MDIFQVSLNLTEKVKQVCWMKCLKVPQVPQEPRCLIVQVHQLPKCPSAKVPKFPSNYSHKRWKVRNLNSLNRNIYVTLKFTSRPKTPRITLKNMAFSEGNQLLAVDFHAALNEINADVIQFTNKWNWKWMV